MEKKRRKIVKGKVENWKWKDGKVQKWGEDLCLVVFFFFFFAFHFSKQRKFVLDVPKWKFSTGKKDFMLGEKIRKNYFAPSEKNFLLRPCQQTLKITWPTKILMLFLSSLDNFLYLFKKRRKKSVDNFEMEHKTYYLWLGVQLVHPEKGIFICQIWNFQEIWFHIINIYIYIYKLPIYLLPAVTSFHNNKKVYLPQ